MTRGVLGCSHLHVVPGISWFLQMQQRVDATKRRVSETASAASASAASYVAATRDTLTDQTKMSEKLNGTKEALIRMGNETFNAPISLTMDTQVVHRALRLARIHPPLVHECLASGNSKPCYLPRCALLRIASRSVWQGVCATDGQGR